MANAKRKPNRFSVDFDGNRKPDANQNTVQNDVQARKSNDSLWVELAGEKGQV
jgi:hypothetical protein